MPSNNSGLQVGYLHGKYGDRMAWLISPGGWFNRYPPSWMPVALDNGAYGAWDKKREWDQHAWLELLEKAHARSKPMWMVVPDVVTKAKETIDRWHEWAGLLREIYPDTPLGFAVQDGMTEKDIPKDFVDGRDIIFVGGSRDWKWQTVEAGLWKKFKRVHVARVNGEKGLWICHSAQVESTDGTGWFRGDKRQLAGLYSYMEQTDPNRPNACF